VVGGGAALTALGGSGVATMAEALRLTGGTWEEFEGDLYFRGWRA
jgi:hypothetical protein